MDKDIVNIVLAPSNDYALFGLLTIKSLLAFSDSKRHYNFHIFSNNLSADNTLRYKDLSSSGVSVFFYDLKDFVNSINLYEYDYVKSNTYFRLLIPEIMPDYKKVLYLDCDLIINKDITELYDLDLNGKAFAGVHDLINPSGEKYLLSLGLNPNNYINGGVLLIDCSICRETCFSERAVSLLKTKKFRFFDQDIINLLGDGKILYLDDRWNVLWHFIIPEFYSQLSSQQQKAWNSAQSNPFIIHYSSKYKPWNTYNYPLSSYFNKSLDGFKYINEYNKIYISNTAQIIDNSDSEKLLIKQLNQQRFGRRKILHLLIKLIEKLLKPKKEIVNK